MAGRSKMKYGPKKVLKLDSVRNEMNVTPLVDVCLVLLIIFMVILPMLTRGKEVPLPKTQFHSEGKDTQQPIVAIDRGGNIYVDQDKAKNIDEMKKMVEDLWRALEQRNQSLSAKSSSDDLRAGERRVLLKADQGINYGKVLPVIMALHDIRAVGIDLGTNEVRESSE